MLAAVGLAAFAMSFVLFKQYESSRKPGVSKVDNPEGVPTEHPPGMVWVPGREFTMGTDEEDASYAERPAHRVRVDGFWMDETEVTNSQFREFVKATHYITVAERKPDWEEMKKQLPPETPKPSDDVLVPGSLVFTPPNKPVSLENSSAWWSWVPGADWQHPEGPGSNVVGKDNHPVVHVSYDDAIAYAKWAKKRLPTEAEWELAARGGLERKRYGWGDEFEPKGKLMANTWQGHFPDKNTKEDGYDRTSPVKSYPANSYGLYDMIGNAWEWCSDWYRPDLYEQRSALRLTNNPSGPDESYDPEEPYTPKRVTKGGSFLCCSNYCTNYRPSARRGTAADSGMSHVSFRCVVTRDMREPKP